MKIQDADLDGCRYSMEIIGLQLLNGGHNFFQILIPLKPTISKNGKIHESHFSRYLAIQY